MAKFLRQTSLIKKSSTRCNHSIFHSLTLLGILAFTTTLTPVYAGVTLSEVGSLANPASDLASNIMGEGITINSAVYRGGDSQAGIFASGAGLSFGSDVLGFTGGVVFSTGQANTVEGPNSANAGVNAPGGVSGDAEFDSIAGVNTLNASWLEIDFTPDLIPNTSVGDIGRITMNIVFGSEEYNAYVYGGVNDVMAIIVNGENKATVPNGADYGIDTINDAATYNPFNGDVANDPNPKHISANFESANPSLYRNNADNSFNTQMNGFTVTIPVTFDIMMGQSNKMKIGIADANDFRNDSWLFVKENSGQTVIVAENDTVTTPTNAPYNIDVLANDYDRQGDPLTIILLDGKAINPGQTILRASGISIKLEADGTLTIKGDGTNPAHDLFTYEMTDGNSGSSIAFVEVTITDPDITPPVPTIVIDSITADNILNLTESIASIEVTGSVGGEFNEGDTVTLNVNGADYTGTTDIAGLYSITVPGSELKSDTTIDAQIDTRDSAGNEGSAATTHDHGVDIELPVPTISVNTITADNVINISESSANIDVAGTVGGDFVAGNTVTLTINGKTYSGSVDDNGFYSISVLGLDLVADLEIDANITTTDIVGNTGSATTTHRHVLDTTAPLPTIAVNNITADNVVNITESTSNINVTGVVGGDFSTGDTVTLSINDKLFTGSVEDSGNYSIAVPGSDLVADLDVEASILATDEAGNSGIANTAHTHTLDTVAPVLTLSINDITADNTINESESKSDVTVTGAVTGEFNSGDIVTLIINAKSYSGSVDDGGKYSIIVSGSDLAVDLLIDAKVTTTDSADNTNTVETTHSHLLDSTLPEPSIVVNSITADNVINEKESNEDVNVTGTVAGDFNTGDQVTLTINGRTYNGVVDTVGNYSVTVPGVELVADLLIDASVSTIDNAGNTNTGEATHTHTVAITLPVPVLSVNGITADNIINESESNSEVNVTGTVTGDFLNGDTVTLLIKANSYTGFVDDVGNYSIAVAGSDLANDLEIEASVVTTDSAGNTGSATTTHTHSIDTNLPGTPTVDILITEKSMPTLSGTATVELGDVLTIFVGGATYIVKPDINNDWSLNTGLVTPNSGTFLPNIDGVANDVAAIITDSTGNPSPDPSNGELTIDNLKATDDSGSAFNMGGSAIVNVLANDTLEGNLAAIQDLILTQNSTTQDTIQLDIATGLISVGVGTPEGIYTLEYGVCERSKPTNCETAIATVSVVGDLDGDGVSDDFDLDTDNDGIPDALEQLTAQNGGDTDGDGLPDEQDLDADGDGISDLMESGVTAALIARLDDNKDGVIDAVVGDNGLANALETDDTQTARLTNAPANTDGIKEPDYQDLDSDNDSIHDLIEGSGFDPLLVDTNNNGVLDAIEVDTDNDGIADSVDKNINRFGGLYIDLADFDSDGIPDYQDLDSDSDGIYDLLEANVVDAALVDINGNGLLDGSNLDSDFDGVLDSGDTDDVNYGDPQATLPLDTDQDGNPDFLDLDSDNDSIPDTTEAGNQDDNNDGLLDPSGIVNLMLPDTDNDGVEDFRDVDSDGDFVNDIEATDFAETDSDNDGRADDTTDDENDGIPNVIDAEPGIYGTGTDLDQDGIPSSIDLDDDNDGLPDLAELDVNGKDIDTDGDGNVDRLDRDSDNDGLPDALEAVAGKSPDVNGDGVIDDFVDDNGDGLHDHVDPALTAVDTDNDGTPDFRDLDTDNDTLYDLYEASLGTGVDADSNGRLDVLTDIDRDGLADVVDTQVIDSTSGVALVNPDTDADGIYDFRDVDSDNDNIPDLDETGDGFNNPLDENNNDVDDYIEALAANPNTSNGTLETAVSGVGGSLNLLGIFFLLGLLGLKRCGRISSHKEKVTFLVSTVALLGLINRAPANECSWSTLENAFKPCFYVGGGVVSSRVDPERGTNGWGTSDSSSSGYNLFVGYHFKPNLFAEFGYTDMGESTLKNSFDATAEETLSYKVPSLHLGYLQRTPIKQVSVYGKAGVSAIQNKVSSSRVSHEKQTSAQLSFGLGAQWQDANSPFFARLGTDFHDRDATAAHLNIGYKFAAKRATLAAKPIPAALPIIRTKVKPTPVRRKPVDTDGDGYPDNIDHCPLSKRGMAVDRRGCEINLPKKPTFSGVLEGVNFHTGSAVLTPIANNILRNVAKQFKRWPDLHVMIVGHTDNVGTDHSNMKLSLQRAKRVTVFLMEHGVKRSDIVSFTGKGEREPRATNQSQAGRAKNRRVELLPQ